MILITHCTYSLWVLKQNITTIQDKILPTQGSSARRNLCMGPVFLQWSYPLSRFWPRLASGHYLFFLLLTDSASLLDRKEGEDQLSYCLIVLSTYRPIVLSSYSLIVLLSYRPIVLSSYFPIILLSYCPIVLSSYRLIVLSSYWFIVLSSYRLIVLSPYRLMVLSSYRLIALLSYRPIVLSVYRLIVLSSYRLIVLLCYLSYSCKIK